MKNKVMVVFTVVLLSGPAAAFAALINLNQVASGSNFALSFGSADPPPIDPISLDFTLSFDNTADINSSTLGLTINSFNSPYEVAYAYNAGNDFLSLATFPLTAGCDNPSGSFCMFIQKVSTFPSLSFVQQSSVSGGYWVADQRTLAPSVPVPAPATLALFGLGLAGLGISRRKRKIES